MPETLLAFTAAGSPRDVSRAIGEFAMGQGSLSAMVVPWESDQKTLSMAITSTRGEGWALEHTNLGTIRLTDLGNDTTRMEILAHHTDHVEQKKLAELFERFASQVQTRFQVAP